MVFTSNTPWKPKNVKHFQKVRNWRNWILSVPRVSVCRETKSPWLRQYQSYISNWYVNRKVFTSTTTWEPRIFFFSKKFEIEFDLYFDLCWRAEIIQVGLNMHLYVDIGDASSSLWGSTSSLPLSSPIYFCIRNLPLSSPIYFCSHNLPLSFPIYFCINNLPLSSPIYFCIHIYLCLLLSISAFIIYLCRLLSISAFIFTFVFSYLFLLS